MVNVIFSLKQSFTLFSPGSAALPQGFNLLALCFPSAALNKCFFLRKVVTIFFVNTLVYYLKGNVEKQREEIITIMTSSSEQTETLRSTFVSKNKATRKNIAGE